MDEEGWRALRFEAGQLFTPSTPIGAAELFAGRQEQMNKLVDAVDQARVVRGMSVGLRGMELRNEGRKGLFMQAVPSKRALHHLAVYGARETME